jgi:hypothetical protein
MSSFSKKWLKQKTRTGTVYRPMVDLLFSEKIGYNLYSFIVDSGADVSLAPRQLAERMGIDWIKGSRVTLTGISPKPECSLEGRIHKVSALIPEIEFELSLSMCFADGNAPYLVGREGFFDEFNITLDKQKRRTVFLTNLKGKSFNNSLPGFRYKEQDHEASRFLFGKD